MKKKWLVLISEDEIFKDSKIQEFLKDKEYIRVHDPGELTDKIISIKDLENYALIIDPKSNNHKYVIVPPEIYGFSSYCSTMSGMDAGVVWIENVLFNTVKKLQIFWDPLPPILMVSILKEELFGGRIQAIKEVWASNHDCGPEDAFVRYIDIWNLDEKFFEI